MIPTKRTYALTFKENDSTELKLPRNFVERNGVVSVRYTDTLSVAATSVRARGAPIKRILLVADGGRVLHAIKVQDAVRKAEIFDQTALGNIVAPPSGTGTGAQVGTIDVPIYFTQPFADNGELTALPAYAYDDLILRIEWGGHGDVYVGGTGVVTVAAGDATFTLNGADNIGDARALASLPTRLGTSVDRYKETANSTANTELSFEVPTSADIRAIMIVTEDANGEPVNTVLNRLTLLENNTLRKYNSVPARVLRAENARAFGVSMPTGTYVIDFAEDRDIAPGSIYQATMKDTVSLVLDVAAVANATIRAHFITIEPPKLAGV